MIGFLVSMCALLTFLASALMIIKMLEKNFDKKEWFEIHKKRNGRKCGKKVLAPFKFDLCYNF